LNRLAQMAALCLALLCLFTIGAGAAVAHLLPARLDLFKLPVITGSVRARVGGELSSAAGPGRSGSRGDSGGRPPGAALPPTPAGVAAKLSALIDSGELGSQVGALVVDYSTGNVLFSQNDDTGFTPASTTKVATAVAAIDTLGAGARFTTSVGLTDSSGTGTGGAGKPVIVLIGGGDPTLSAGRYPAGFYPRPAALVTLAAQTARALHAKGISSVRLTYDNSLFVGPMQAEGWPEGGASYIETGNAAPVTGLEVDQGRLAADGLPEDSDDNENFTPRSLHPGLDAAMGFARLLRKDGIKLGGGGAPKQSPVGQQDGKVIASVRSVTLAEMVQWMLEESNNMIAETLARHVAIATGKPATFSGAAAAVGAVDAKLGVRGIHLVDGSGLSPLDKITPHALVKLVELAAGQGGGPGLRSVISGLPVAGFSGTLGPGSSFGPFGRAGLGVVRAKTGNISGVATLTGIAYAADGDVLAFAFMGNEISKKDDLPAESALTDLATALAGCGCR
jgi:D-alanyl-D-alanine carboxypeptidase/D-alanyl-D-alanine-endopeptidase (penicillin-binding protein 4)